MVIGGEEPVTGAVAAAIGGGAVVGDGDAEELAGVESVVYLAAARCGEDGPDPGDAARVVEAVGEARVPHVVLVSSAAVHEPHQSHAGMLTEERLPPQAPANPISARWRRLEEVALGRLGEERVAVLRPAAVPVAGWSSPLGRLFTGRVAVVLAGHDPRVQLLGVDDLAAVVARVVERRATGAFNVAPAGVVPLRYGLRRAGVRPLPLPYSLARLFVPAARLAFIRYSWTISGERLAARLGLEPRRSSVEVACGARAPDPPTSSGVAEEVGSSGAGGEADSLGSRAGSSAVETFDDFGQDKEYMARMGRTLWRFMHDFYWRVEVRGLEHVPRAGPAVLVGVHRGFMPFDAVMALHEVIEATGRHPRFLIHPTLVKFPFLFDFITRLGGLVACRENADRVLGEGGLLGIYPEGIRGAFSYYRDAYQLKRFGRDEYVRMALRNRAPLVPFVTVGSAEMFPVLAKLHWRWWRRWSEWPCLPITPTFPWLPLPLPSKWHTLYLEPLHVEERYPPEAAGDPESVRAIGAEVEKRLQAAMDRIVARRPAIFWGSAFEDG